MYRVLLPVDDDIDRAVTQARSVTRLPGRDTDVEVHLLHVYSGSESATDSPPAGMDSGQRATEILEEAGVTVKEETRRGDPAEEIVDAAQRSNADQIVLGGRKRSPLGSMLFGSVSQAVVMEANRPVTITGDEGMQEPSHVCESCGERYFAEGSEIRTCRNCGGSKVEAVA